MRPGYEGEKRKGTCRTKIPGKKGERAFSTHCGKKEKPIFRNSRGKKGGRIPNFSAMWKKKGKSAISCATKKNHRQSGKKRRASSGRGEGKEKRALIAVSGAVKAEEEKKRRIAVLSMPRLSFPCPKNPVPPAKEKGNSLAEKPLWGGRMGSSGQVDEKKKRIHPWPFPNRVLNSQGGARKKKKSSRKFILSEKKRTAGQGCRKGKQAKRERLEKNKGGKAPVKAEERPVLRRKEQAALGKKNAQSDNERGGKGRSPFRGESDRVKNHQGGGIIDGFALRLQPGKFPHQKVGDKKKENLVSGWPPL